MKGKSKIGLNIVLVVMAVLLFAATFIWDKKILQLGFSIWTAGSSVVLGVMLLMLLFELFLWILNKSFPPTIKEILTTILIILVADIFLLQTDSFFWNWTSKLTIITTATILFLIVLYLTIKTKFSKTKNTTN